MGGAQPLRFACGPGGRVKCAAVPTRSLVLVSLLAACGARPQLPDSGTALSDAGDPPDSGAATRDSGEAHDGGGGGFDAGVGGDGGTGLVDRDLDGLDDALEERLAIDYLPNLSLHPNDDCPLGLLAYRARPHPLDPKLVMILYDHLYERDCGIGSHVGDNEVFAITVNPAKPAPAGITALKTISHQNTVCQKITACGTCGDLAACDQAPDGRPRVYASRDKHGTYVQKSSCMVVAICTDDCAVGDQRGVPLANVGEPNAHLIEDLTAAGFITADAGWTATELFHFDPWGPEKFGGAGKPSEDFPDPAFDTAPCE